MMKYKHALQLYWIYNSTDMNVEWLDLNFQQSFGNRNSYVRIHNDSRIKIGENILTNRFILMTESTTIG